MKKLLLLLFAFSINVSAQEVVPANAVCASDQGTNVYGFDVCVWPTVAAGGFDDEYGLRSAYKNDFDEWIFLAERTDFIRNFTDEAATDARFQTFLDAINLAIEQKLAPIGGGAEPTSGIARIQWLAGRIVFVSNSVQSP